MGEGTPKIVHFQAGSAAAACGIIGTGLALALPEEKWIGWLLVAIGLLVFAFDVRIEGWWPRIGRGRKMLSQWGPWLLIIGGPILGAVWLYVETPQLFGKTTATRHE